jgi:predicted nucleotidyltransferase
MASKPVSLGEFAERRTCDRNHYLSGGGIAMSNIMASTMKSPMNLPIQAELDLITTTIKTNTVLESIYLFGSCVNGVPNNDSDIDIYVVVPDSEVNIIDLCAKIRLDLSQKKTRPVDLLIEKKSVFENRKNRLTLENVISNEGVKIYG